MNEDSMVILTLTEAVAYLNGKLELKDEKRLFTYSGLRREVKDGNMPCMKIGKRHFFSQMSLDSWLSKQLRGISEGSC